MSFTTICTNTTIKYTLQKLDLYYILFNILEKIVFIEVTSSVFIVVFVVRTSFLEVQHNFTQNIENYDKSEFERIFGFVPENWSFFFYNISCNRRHIKQRLVLPSKVGLCNQCKRPSEKEDLGACEVGLCLECRVDAIKNGLFDELFYSERYKLSEEEKEALKPKKKLEDFREEEKEQMIHDLLEVQLTDLEKQTIARKCGVWIKEEDEKDNEETPQESDVA